MRVGEANRHPDPVIAAYSLEQTTVEEGNPHTQVVEIVVIGHAVRCQPFVEQRFQHIVVKVVVPYDLALVGLLEKVTRPISPLSSLADPQPAFLLDKVEEDQLTHESLGEGRRVNVLAFKLGAHGGIVLHELVQVRLQCQEKRLVLLEELVRDRFDAEGLFQFGQVGRDFIFEEANKTALGGVAAFAGADQKGEALGRGQRLLEDSLTIILLLEAEFELDEGKAPLRGVFTGERHQGCVFACRIQVAGDEIALRCPSPLQRRVIDNGLN